jgi:hypothetical protein
MVKPDEYMKINIGSSKNMKMVKIGKGTSNDERKEIEDLIQVFRYVFSWSYDYLKYTRVR